MSSDPAATWSLRRFAREAESRGTPVKIDELRRQCREGKLAAEKVRGTWRISRFEARRRLEELSTGTASVVETAVPTSSKLGDCETARTVSMRQILLALDRTARSRTSNNSSAGRDDSVDYDVPFHPIFEDVDYAGEWGLWVEEEAALESPATDRRFEAAATDRRPDALNALRELASGWAVLEGAEAPAPVVVERRALRRRSLFRSTDRFPARTCDLASGLRRVSRTQVPSPRSVRPDVAERAFAILMSLAEGARRAAADVLLPPVSPALAEEESDGSDSVSMSTPTPMAEELRESIAPEVREEIVAAPAEEADRRWSETREGRRLVEEHDEEGRLLSRLEAIEISGGVDGEDAFLPEGAYVSFHPDGSEAARGYYVQGRLEGGWRQWHPGGAPAVTGQHRLGQPEGEWVFFHANGTKAREGSFEKGLPVGVWRHWDRQGRLVAEMDESRDLVTS